MKTKTMWRAAVGEEEGAMEEGEEKAAAKSKGKGRSGTKAKKESAPAAAMEAAAVDAAGRRAMSREEAVLELSEMARHEGNATAKLGALKELARIEGWGVPERDGTEAMRVVMLETPPLGQRGKGEEQG